MITYKNYYDITSSSDRSRYQTIKEKNIDLMLHYVIGDEKEEKDLTQISDYATYVKKYLVSIGMSEDAINKLVAKLTN